MFNPRAATRALLAVVDKYPAALDQCLEHPYSPFGDVEPSHGCTACGACVGACPTGSLALERDENSIALVFDAQLCIRCAECVPACPENVLSVKGGTNIRRISESNFSFCRTTEALCKKCGGVMAPQEMLNRIAALLGSDSTIAAIQLYCHNCQGDLIVFWLGSPRC